MVKKKQTKNKHLFCSWLCSLSGRWLDWIVSALHTTGCHKSVRAGESISKRLTQPIWVEHGLGSWLGALQGLLAAGISSRVYWASSEYGGLVVDWSMIRWLASSRVSVPSCKASYHEVLEVSLFLPYLWIKPINKASLYSREGDFNSITQREE